MISYNENFNHEVVVEKKHVFTCKQCGKQLAFSDSMVDNQLFNHHIELDKHVKYCNHSLMKI